MNRFRLRSSSWLIVVVLIFPMEAWCYAFGSTYSFGAGIFNHNAGKTATDATSTAKPFWNEVYTQLSLTSIHPINFDWAFSPTFFYALPSKKSPEGNSSSSVFGLNLRGLYLLSSGWDIHFGLGLLYYRIVGTGGTVTLSNGSGTSTYASADKTKSSNQFALDLGGAYTYQGWRFEASLLVTNALASSKMALNQIFAITKEFY